MEEPQIHLLAAKGLVDKVLNPDFMVEVFNNTVRGLRQDRGLVPHLLGQPGGAAPVPADAELRARRSSRSRASTPT